MKTSSGFSVLFQLVARLSVLFTQGLPALRSSRAGGDRAWG